MNLHAKYIADKLDSLENLAFKQGYGSDYLESIGEQLKFYAYDCFKNDKNLTFWGLISFLEKTFPTE